MNKRNQGSSTKRTWLLVTWKLSRISIGQLVQGCQYIRQADNGATGELPKCWSILDTVRVGRPGSQNVPLLSRRQIWIIEDIIGMTEAGLGCWHEIRPAIIMCV